MKRFLVFAGDSYYPDGGWDDLIETTNSFEEALEIVEVFGSSKSIYTYWWAHVVDSETGLIEVRREK